MYILKEDLVFTVAGFSATRIFLTLKNDTVVKMSSFKFYKHIGVKEINPEVFNLVIVVLY